ncbi:MAG: hypothetical protein HFJ27_04585 [Clostridia bacterium]|nr:hypothetical protein [Clostridia bacterium]
MDNTIKDYENKLEAIENEGQQTKTKIQKPHTFMPILISILLISLEIGIVSIIPNAILIIVSSIIVLISILGISYTQIKKKRKYQNQKNAQNVENQEKKHRKELLQATIKKLKQEQQNKEKQEKQDYENKLQILQNNNIGKMPANTINEILQEKLIQNKIIETQNEQTQSKLKVQSIILEQETILPKIENLTQIEEELKDLEEQYEELTFQNEAIELAKQELEKAYDEMKKKVTPNFTNQLSKIVKRISNGKYTNVKFDEKEGIIVEIENGDYVPIDYLSIGTIEQLYLSLRLSAQSNMKKENLPIILDESFAYYDQERLKNILQFLDKEYPNRQVVIFTCTNREKEILEEENIPYHFIKLS